MREKPSEFTPETCFWLSKFIDFFHQSVIEAEFRIVAQSLNAKKLVLNFLKYCVTLQEGEQKLLLLISVKLELRFHFKQHFRVESQCKVSERHVCDEDIEENIHQICLSFDHLHTMWHFLTFILLISGRWLVLSEQFWYFMLKIA